jgi:DNA-binding CsgD family transcriptional regulator
VKALTRTGDDMGIDRRVLRAVAAANETQKRVLVDKVVARLGEDLQGRRFALWGLAFKPDTDDMHEAPSRVIVHELLRRGAAIRARWSSTQNLLLSDCITPGELGRSEFSDFQRQVPYCYAMAMLTGVAQQAVAAVSVHRSAGERDFTREEQAVLACIGPHLARAVVLRRLANDSLQWAETGILVFSRTGRSLYLNAPARAFLGGTPPQAVLAALPAQTSGVIRLGSQTFRLSRLPWSAASLLRPFALDDAAENVISGPRPASVLVDCSPERVAAVPGAVIVVLRPYHARTDLVRRLAQYGLSPRQSEIAAWALRGLTNSEIAQQISIGDQTVRDHFQEIYCRIGVHSRTELLGNSGTVYLSPGASGRQWSDCCSRPTWPGGFPPHGQFKSPDESGSYSVIRRVRDGVRRHFAGAPRYRQRSTDWHALSLRRYRLWGSCFPRDVKALTRTGHAATIWASTCGC